MRSRQLSAILVRSRHLSATLVRCHRTFFNLLKFFLRVFEKSFVSVWRRVSFTWVKVEENVCAIQLSVINVGVPDMSRIER